MSESDAGPFFVHWLHVGARGECLRKFPAPNMFKASMFVQGDMFFGTLGRR